MTLAGVASLQLHLHSEAATRAPAVEQVARDAELMQGRFRMAGPASSQKTKQPTTPQEETGNRLREGVEDVECRAL